MKCKKCGNPLNGNQKSYCSRKCSKNHLKALYRKRNKEKVNAYNRQWNKSRRATKRSKLFLSNQCYFCKDKEKLVDHHVSYDPEILVRLCDPCHKKLHRLLRLAKKAEIM
jgi:hypothetical protein